MTTTTLKQTWLRWDEVSQRAEALARHIDSNWKNVSQVLVYAIPNGGIPAAISVQARSSLIRLVEDPTTADVYIDDIIDSGRTAEKYNNRPFYALVDKRKEFNGQWVSFPWERMSNGNNGIENNIRRTLQYIGEDPDREGLRETPARVAKSYEEIYAGYKQDPSEVLKVFEDGSCDEMVVIRDVEWFSNCEHHMLPFFGRAHIAYIPDGKVIGVSKLVRILEVFSRRLQIQERLTEQVTKALDENLKPKGSACVLEAQHFCMTCRGVGKQHSKMITSSLTGLFKTDAAARAEFMGFIK